MAKNKEKLIKCEHKNITKWKNGLRQCKDCLVYWDERELTKKDVAKILKTKEDLELSLLKKDKSFDVGNYGLQEWVDKVCEKLNIK